MRRELEYSQSEELPCGGEIVYVKGSANSGWLRSNRDKQFYTLHETLEDAISGANATESWEYGDSCENFEEEVIEPYFTGADVQTSPAFRHGGAIKTLHTRYTKLGYACYLDAEQEPMHRGGNHPMCSESVLAPPYAGDNPNIRPLRLAQIKALAKSFHLELVQEHGYTDGGLMHDRDDQDETLIMLGMGDHPSVSKRLRTVLKWDE